MRCEGKDSSSVHPASRREAYLLIASVALRNKSRDIRAIPCQGFTIDAECRGISPNPESKEVRALNGHRELTNIIARQKP